MIHTVTADIAQVHRRLGDARLFRHFDRFSVGQSLEALQELTQGAAQSGAATASRLADELQSRQAAMLTILDPEYPRSFRVLDKDAPPLLYIIGDLNRLDSRAIAIIGTRRPSRVGREATRIVASAAANSDWVIVSGNAPGVDATAHAAALESGGETLVFPPCPLDSYKPSFRIDAPQRTTVVSPFAPGIRVDPWMFLRRNSLVAAQCSAAFIAETGMRGGTCDTIKKLGKLQRPMFATALPDDAKFARAHQLLSAGNVTLLDVTAPVDNWFPRIQQDAEECMRHPAVCIPVLDDLFSEELL